MSISRSRGRSGNRAGRKRGATAVYFPSSWVFLVPPASRDHGACPCFNAGHNNGAGRALEMERFCLEEARAHPPVPHAQ